MCNPYDNNPFKTDKKELKSERDANRELARTVANDLRRGIGGIFAPMKKDEMGFWESSK